MSFFTNKTTVEFSETENLSKSNAEQFSERLRQEYLYLQGKDYVEPESDEIETENMVYDELAEFLHEHVETVGKEQAIKDFQCGLNFLHKDIADLIKEDGDFGEKTYTAFYEILQHYPLEVVKESILRGAKSNIGIDYEYSLDEDPKILIETVEENLNKEEI